MTATEPAVEFGELPPDTRGGSRWVIVTAELKTRPGVWARVLTCENDQRASNHARQIRCGGRVAFRPQGSFEATTRGPDVWARYVGTGEVAS